MEVVTHGNQFYMVAYGIGVLPLIKRLKVVYPDVTQPWYADDAGLLSIFDNLELYFNSLKRNGPARGYYPYPTKLILIMHPENIKVGELFGAHHKFTVCTSSRYLVSYIRDE